MTWPEPTVVISDRAPEQIAVRNETEANAVRQLLETLRAGHDPVALIYRTPAGEIEVAARSKSFGSVQQAVAVMEQATAKLVSRLFTMRRVPARPS